jgi:hypothetical protein
VFSSPKTRSSRAWIGLSERVVHALHRQRERHHTQQLAADPAWQEQDLVFTRATGQPLRHAAHQAVDAIDNALTTAENVLPAASEPGRLNQPAPPGATTTRPLNPAGSGLKPAAIPPPRRPQDISPAACNHIATTLARH